MKKFLILAFVLIALVVQSQSLDINFKSVETIDTYTMDGDTTWTFDVSAEYQWEFGFIWTSLSATDGSIKVQFSPFTDGAYFVDYPNMDSLLMDVASGYGVMRGVTNTFMCRRIRVNVDSGTSASGTLLWRGNLIRIKQ